MDAMDADVIVLGAGFAGLAAAERLADAGRRVLVLEARDRVGGRARTDHFEDGLWLDFGGQWIGPGHDEMYALASGLDVSIWSMYVQGCHILRLGNRNRAYRGMVPLTLSPWTLLNLGWGFLRLHWLTRRVPLEAPWKAKGARELDQRTLGDWMRANLRDRHAFNIFAMAVEAVFAAHPDDISLLHGLFYLRAGDGLEKLTSSENGAQQDRAERGMQGLAETWAERLRGKGVAFRLDCPARVVEQGETGVRVHTDDSVHEGRRVVCTLPPVMTLEVEFRPAMPEARRHWCEGLPPGNVIKCFAVYDRPFWRDQGLSGSAAGDTPPVHVSFDVTPPGENRGVLMGFFEGRDAAEWADADEASRREAVLEAFGRFFGQQALQPQRYIDHVWRDEAWSRGCYAGVARPGIVSSVGDSARAPHGHVYWAGTETATRYTGYLEGAVRSGHRAAEEVEASLV